VSVWEKYKAQSNVSDDEYDAMNEHVVGFWQLYDDYIASFGGAPLSEKERIVLELFAEWIAGPMPDQQMLMAAKVAGSA